MRGGAMKRGGERGAGRGLADGADALAARRFFRRGWVTFDRSVNIKEICWNLQNIRVSAARASGSRPRAGTRGPGLTGSAVCARSSASVS